jgi:hypothetical protein
MIVENMEKMTPSSCEEGDLTKVPILKEAFKEK